MNITTEGGAAMNSLERFIGSEARRDLPAIMAAVRAGYALGLRGGALAEFTRAECAKSVCAVMAKSTCTEGTNR